MNSDGSNAVNITNDGEGAASLDPAWSPDGARIAVWYAVSPDTSINIMNGDGSGRVSLDRTSEGDAHPDWSPDGTRIVFDANNQAGVRTMSTDGTDVRTVTFGLLPVWSPDGTRIAFLRRLPPCTNCTGIYTSKPDGSDLVEVFVSSDLIGSFDWSPDGSRFAFGASNGGQWEVYTLNADGSGLSQVTSNTVFDVDPVWSPDGTRIAFFSARTPVGIYAMDPDGTDVSFIGPGHGPDWQPIPPPRRADYKNQSAFCAAVRDFSGEQQFRVEYGRNGNGANAFGKCVSGK